MYNAVNRRTPVCILEKSLVTINAILNDATTKIEIIFCTFLIAHRNFRYAEQPISIAF